MNVLNPVKPPVVLLVAAAVCLLSGSPDARADFFKYKDDSGAVVITNNLEDVPQKYRKRVKVVWDKDLEAKDPLARRQAAAAEQRELREQQDRRKAQQQEQEQQKGRGLKTPDDGKKLVITIDGDTGEVIRRFE
jgi:hypothetical protein